MARLNVLLTGYEITDYLFQRTSSTALALDHDTIRGTADLEIWTGAGGTGTQLVLTTDYTVSDEDTDLSTEAGVSIYTKLAIINGTYHNVDLYATYKTIGDYNSTQSVRLVQIGLKEITGNYTVTADDRTIIVNTASAVTITIPDDLPQGFDVCISRAVASTNAVTVAMSGSETIEGGSSLITHGEHASLRSDDAEVVIKKKTDTSWKFVSGIISGSNAYGEWSKFSNGKLIQTSIDLTPTPSTILYIQFPVSFYDGNVACSAGMYMSVTWTSSTYGVKLREDGTFSYWQFFTVNACTGRLTAIGKWK